MEKYYQWHSVLASPTIQIENVKNCSPSMQAVEITLLMALGQLKRNFINSLFFIAW